MKSLSTCGCGATANALPAWSYRSVNLCCTLELQRYTVDSPGFDSRHSTFQTNKSPPMAAAQNTWTSRSPSSLLSWELVRLWRHCLWEPRLRVSRTWGVGTPCSRWPRLELQAVATFLVLAARHYKGKYGRRYSCCCSYYYEMSPSLLFPSCHFVNSPGNHLLFPSCHFVNLPTQSRIHIIHNASCEWNVSFEIVTIGKMRRRFYSFWSRCPLYFFRHWCMPETYVLPTSYFLLQDLQMAPPSRKSSWV